MLGRVTLHGGYAVMLSRSVQWGVAWFINSRTGAAHYPSAARCVESLTLFRSLRSQSWPLFASSSAHRLPSRISMLANSAQLTGILTLAFAFAEPRMRHVTPPPPSCCIDPYPPHTSSSNQHTPMPLRHSSIIDAQTTGLPRPTIAQQFSSIHRDITSSSQQLFYIHYTFSLNCPPIMTLSNL